MGQHENLRQLSRFFELDYLVHSGGQSRNEASPSEYTAYVESAFMAIRMRREGMQ